MITPLRAADDWREFRGYRGQGHSSATDIPTTWSEQSNVAWKTPLPGKGWSSPVVERNLIWLTSAIETPATPEQAEQRKKANTGDQALNVAQHVDFFALAVDVQTGKLVHNVKVLEVDEPQWIHTLNSYASPTPALQDGKLFCHFGAYGTACLDTATQKVLWQNTELQIMHENGPGSSPVLWKNLLIVHCDGSDEQYVAALDQATGKVVWRTNRSGEMNPNKQLVKAYGTPQIAELAVAGKTQEVLLSPAADWLYAYDPANGKELWKLKYGVLGFSIVPRPVMGHGMFYMCTSFMNSEMLAIRIDGLGEKPEPHIAWRYKKQVPNMPSPLLIGDELYFVHDGGVATCLDALTGKAHWTERLNGKFCASPLFVDGKILFFGSDGITIVCHPGTSFEKLASNKLDGTIMASPIAIDNALFIRTDAALYRIVQR